MPEFRFDPSLNPAENIDLFHRYIASLNQEFEKLLREQVANVLPLPAQPQLRQQQVVYIEERIAQEIVKTPPADLRLFYSLPGIGGTFADLWQKFYQVATVKTRPSS